MLRFLPYVLSQHRHSTTSDLCALGPPVGLQDIIDPKWIRLFDQRELQMLVGGVDTDVRCFHLPSL